MAKVCHFTSRLYHFTTQINNTWHFKVSTLCFLTKITYIKTVFYAIIIWKSAIFWQITSFYVKLRLILRQNYIILPCYSTHKQKLVFKVSNSCSLTKITYIKDMFYVVNICKLVIFWHNYVILRQKYVILPCDSTHE